ncbi:MAG TPA: SpoIID/LytB domain-containing protein [Smithellaceae bacterium]|nr:SpoIID/LytB domain-containing protein [Smithellaceae bacterium]
MIDHEPNIQAALLQDSSEARLMLKGAFVLPDEHLIEGEHKARAEDGQILLADRDGREMFRAKDILLSPAAPAESFFTIFGVKIGIDFHWQRVQEQSFRGALFLSGQSRTTFHLINRVPLEEYLASVISSEMSANAPLEFLKAQAVTSRSWLVAMLDRKKTRRPPPESRPDERCVWQDVNDHEGFDVCADDHCQRYQGITRIVSENVARAIGATRGMFLTSGDQICDARYYKCCGGRTEAYATAWEEAFFPYLSGVADHDRAGAPIVTERDAAEWLRSSPEAFCNTADLDLLRRILPSFDQETLNFYRWRVAYSRQELEQILRAKSGIDFGILQNLEPLARGPSGRIFRLKIEGSRRTVVVGKELEIRRWLSPTHLLSSAFVVSMERDEDGNALSFLLEGGGWGHGVGLCQIGAAVMASGGRGAEEILAHYFPGAALRKLY